MKILMSTTFGHNPGDECIALGVKRLLEAKFGSDIEYIYYQRNPDLQEGPERRQRSGLVGNYMTSGSILKHVDMVVAAGSPEWRGGPLEALYQGIKMYAPNIPLYALGIGLGNPWLSLTDLDREILSRPETKIITRSQETTDALAKEGIKSEAWVCPAIFAFDVDQDLTFSQALKRQTIEKPLLILQAPGYGWHEVPERVLAGYKDGNTDILTVHVKEFEYFSDQGCNPLYAGDTASFANIVSRYQKVISTRLHGAIGALSLGVRAVVVSDGDFRIETCSKMFGALPIAKTVREALADPFKYDYMRNVAFDMYLDKLNAAP